MTNSVSCTSKQRGDACEMLVAAEMTFAGVPTAKMPDNWPCYDLIAQPPDGRTPQRISVKSRTFKRGGDTFVTYKVTDNFDWLAIVLLPGDGQAQRRIFILPKSIADDKARSYDPQSKVADDREWRLNEVAGVLGAFENNFCLLSIAVA